MSLVTPSQSNPGDTIEASDINGPVNQLAAVLNGNVDSTNLADSSVTSVKLANQSVSPSRLATGATSASVNTSEASATQAYGDNLITLGPSVTVTIGLNGVALVAISAKQGSDSTTSKEVFTSFTMSGANTVAANDVTAISYQVYAANASDTKSGVFVLTGLNPGSTTFKLQYRVTGDTGRWLNRRISVVPL